MKKETEGFYYNKKLEISIQGCDSNKTVKQCIHNNIQMYMEITLNDETPIIIILD